LRRKASPPPESEESISDSAASRFALADLDGDGRLSVKEFESDLQSLKIRCLLFDSNQLTLVAEFVHDQAKLEDVPPSALALRRLFFVSMVGHHHPFVFPPHRSLRCRLLALDAWIMA
jgi:hypothetical protein